MGVVDVLTPLVPSSLPADGVVETIIYPAGAQVAYVINLHIVAPYQLHIKDPHVQPLNL
jgi:hypothetical protein